MYINKKQIYLCQVQLDLLLKNMAGIDHQAGRKKMIFILGTKIPV
jgi:hypothetical protein